MRGSSNCCSTPVRRVIGRNRPLSCSMSLKMVGSPSNSHKIMEIHGKKKKSCYKKFERLYYHVSTKSNVDKTNPICIPT